MIDLIIKKTKNTHLEQKGLAQVHHLRQVKEDWHQMTKAMFDELEFNSENSTLRIQHGIPFLGRLAHQLFDVAGPDKMDAFNDMSDKLLRLSENQQAKIKNLKKTMKHEHSTIIDIIDKIKLMTNFSKNMTNELIEQENTIMNNTDIDTLYITALSLLDHANLEHFKREDIKAKASKMMPSIYTFPKKYVQKMVKKAIEKSRVEMPLFLNSHEIHELFLFESSMTTFDPEKKQINSILDVPLVTFSDNFKSKRVPQLSPEQLNRMYRLTQLTNLDIDRFLCNPRQHGLRFLSFDSFERCQKHTLTNIFVCKDREILMKYDSIIDCNNITSLPKTLVLPMTKNDFFIENRYESFTIFCNDRENRIIEPSLKPIRVTIPSHCYIKSNSLFIGNLSDSNVITFEQQEEKIQVVKVKSSHFEPFEIDLGQFDTDINVTDIPDNSDDLDAEFEYELKSAKELLKRMKEGRGSFSISEILALVFASISITLVALLFVLKKCEKTTTSKETSYETHDKTIFENQNRICQIQKLLDEENAIKIKKKAELNLIIEGLKELYLSKDSDTADGYHNSVLKTINDIHDLIA